MKAISTLPENRAFTDSTCDKETPIFTYKAVAGSMPKALAQKNVQVGRVVRPLSRFSGTNSIKAATCVVGVDGYAVSTIGSSASPWAVMRPMMAVCG